MHEWMNECMNEWMNKWIIKWIPETLEMNKWMSGWNNISECVSAHRWHKMGGYSLLVSLVEGKEMAKACRKWSYHIEKPYTFQDFRISFQDPLFSLPVSYFAGWKILGLRIRSTTYRESQQISAKAGKRSSWDVMKGSMWEFQFLWDESIIYLPWEPTFPSFFRGYNL